MGRQPGARWQHGHVRKHLLLRIVAPLVSFGGETIDSYGVTRDFPSASMLAGLFANALGWRRTEIERLQALQDRLAFAVYWERELEPQNRGYRDFQTAQLQADDAGWTTSGVPEHRQGVSYQGPHLRYRDYHADVALVAVCSLAPDDDGPALEDLERALERPARPLFFGRKPCLPSERIFGGYVEGGNVAEAMVQAARKSVKERGDDADPSEASAMRALWPSLGAVPPELVQHRQYALADQRNWRSGLHGGSRQVCEGRIELEQPS